MIENDSTIFLLTYQNTILFSINRSDRFLKRFNGPNLKNSEKKGPQLTCGSDKITIEFDANELKARKLRGNKLKINTEILVLILKIITVGVVYFI